MVLALLVATLAHGGQIDEVKGWRVTRSVQIVAAPEDVYPYLANLEMWPTWTAWSKEMDPEATWTYDGSPSQVGQKSAWEGPKMGEGSMVVTSVAPPTSVTYDLFFDNRPTANPGQLTLSAGAHATTVTWDTAGKMGAIGRALFRKKVESMIGDDFEKGLSTLKVKAEADAGARHAAAVAEAEKRAGELESAAKAADDAAAKSKVDAEAAKTAADAATAAVATAKKKEKAAAEAKAAEATKAAADAAAKGTADAAAADIARKAAEEARAAAKAATDQVF